VTGRSVHGVVSSVALTVGSFAYRTGNRRRYVDRNIVRTTRENHGTKPIQ
jgi:hypothetical protein